MIRPVPPHAVFAALTRAAEQFATTPGTWLLAALAVTMAILAAVLPLAAAALLLALVVQGGGVEGPTLGLVWAGLAVLFVGGLALVLAVAGALSTGLIAEARGQVRERRLPTVGGVFDFASRNFLQASVLSWATSLLSFLGFFLCVAPGVILGVAFVPACAAFVVEPEPRRGLAALRTCWAGFRREPLVYFIIYCGFVAIQMICGLLPLVGYLVALPLSVMFLLHACDPLDDAAWHAFKGARPGPPLSPPAPAEPARASTPTPASVVFEPGPVIEPTPPDDPTADEIDAAPAPLAPVPVDAFADDGDVTELMMPDVPDPPRRPAPWQAGDFGVVMVPGGLNPAHAVDDGEPSGPRFAVFGSASAGPRVARPGPALSYADAPTEVAARVDNLLEDDDDPLGRA